MNECILRAEGLSVGYGGEPVLRDVRFSLRRGEILALLGPNGAGKTTLLKTLVRELPPMEGRILLKEQPLETLSAGDVARTVSIVMTNRLEGDLLTVEDVVRSGRYPYTGHLGLLSPGDWEKVRQAMALTRVEELRERDFRRLSDGQRQRVLLARAICQEPSVLVMDEPASFLDLRCRMELVEILRDLSGRGLAVLLSLHELDLARRAADQVLCLREGRVDRTGTPGEVLTPRYIETLYDLRPGSLEEGPQASSSRSGAGAGSGPRYAFFQNRDCEMFPCHPEPAAERFNCLFCYCPLYALGERCGGNCAYTEQGIKSCMACSYPHHPEHYSAITARFPELAALAEKRPGEKA